MNLAEIAQTTAGFTGADLENLMNEAAINAARHNRKFICNQDVKESFVKVGIGAEKKSRVISERRSASRLTTRRPCDPFHVLPDVGRCTPFPSFPRAWGQQATPCRCRKGRKCS